MAFRPCYDSQDEVPQQLREHYAENSDGVWVLQVEGVDGWAVDNVAGLKTNTNKLLKQTRDLQKELAPYRALERPPETIQEALAELDQLKSSAGDVPKQVADLKRELTQVREQAQKEVEKATGPISDKLNRRTQQLQQLMVDARLTEAIVAAKGRPHMLIPALRPHVQIEEDDGGNLRPVVVDAEGTPRVAGQNLQPMSFTELVAEYAADPEWAGAFQATGSSGGGTRPAPGAPKGALTPEAVSNMSMAEYRQARADGRLQ